MQIIGIADAMRRGLHSSSSDAMVPVLLRLGVIIRRVVQSAVLASHKRCRRINAQRGCNSLKLQVR